MKQTDNQFPQVWYLQDCKSNHSQFGAALRNLIQQAARMLKIWNLMCSLFVTVANGEKIQWIVLIVHSYALTCISFSSL